MLLILHAIQGALMWCNLHFVPWSRLAMKRGFMYTMHMVKIAQPLFVDVIGYLISMWSRGFICEAFFACYLCNILWTKRECIFSLSLFFFLYTMVFLHLVSCLLCFRTLENIVLVHYRETHEVHFTITHLLSLMLCLNDLPYSLKCWWLFLANDEDLLFCYLNLDK